MLSLRDTEYAKFQTATNSKGNFCDWHWGIKLIILLRDAKLLLLMQH